ncbi:MAG: hypothetical protein JO086_17750 [Acidimicrobiia bacterium]|nr:hypothetical protein [Acidimicrobiia bacterium]
MLPPLVLTAAFGLARAARLGFVALGLIVLIWIQPLARIDGALKPLRADVKSTEKGLAARVAPYLVPSDVVVVTQLEEGPVLHYYLHVPVHLATPAGPVSDPGVADWRDATDRLTAATPAVDLLPLVAGLHIGQHVVVVCPRQASTAHELPWFRLMDTHCRDWNATLASDSRFQPAPIAGLDAVQPGMSRYVTLYNKVSM